MKLNVIEMMRNLSNYRYEKLYNFASEEGIKIPTPSCSKVELITLLIAHRIAKGDNTLESNRRNYCLQCDDAKPYFLKLTPDQYNFLEWCINNDMCFSHSTVYEMGDVDWETP